MAGGRKSKKAKKELTQEEKLERALVPAEEQPYEVPGNWCWTTLRNVVEIIMGQSPAGTAITEDDSYTPLIGGAADMGILYPKITRYTKIPTKISGDNDLILCVRATLGRPIFSNGEYCLGRGVAALRPYQGKKEFYRYFFLNFEQYLYDNATGTTFAQVSKDTLQDMPFPLPPLPEQKRIVDRIESIFARLDEAGEKAQAVVDGFELRKSAILHRAFTGELTKRWRLEHGITLKKWSKRKLKDCGDWCGGGTPSMAHPEYWDGGSLLWVTSKDMKFDVIEDTLMCTNMVGVDNSSANYIEKPSVLFVMRSGILRRTLPIAMVKVPFTVNQDLKAISPAVDLNLEYLFWACRSSEKIIRNTCMKNGTTVESINARALMEFEIPIAPQEEQIEIVNCIVSMLEKEQQAKRAAETVLGQIDIMKKAILARAFQGGLGTNDPAEESAAKLLRAIL